MTNKVKKMIFNTSMILCLTLGGATAVYANEEVTPVVESEYRVANGALDGLGSSPTQQNQNANTYVNDEANRESANAVGDLFQNATIDSESTSKASTFLEPLARGINIVVAFILGFTSLAIFLITAIDLLYIGFPPVRNMLNPQSSGGGMGGGYGGGGQQEQKVRWVSDEAVACASSGSSGGGMGSPMGGMGSHMGGASNGGSAKSMIMSYLKKRTVFLIVFAICVILFTSTVFTDLGLRIGMLLLGWITGMTGSIPV